MVETAEAEVTACDVVSACRIVENMPDGPDDTSENKTTDRRARCQIADR